MNEGNIAEAVLGAALVAKIAARQPNGEISRITNAQVQAVIRVMQKTPVQTGTAQKQVIKVDLGGVAKDRITFYMNLGTAMMNEFRRAGPTELSRLSQAAASYANSPRIAGMASALFTNNIPNKISIDVDGISANTSTKADVVVTLDKFVFDKISLKAGSMKSGHTLGQIGGNSWASLLRLFVEGYNKATKKDEIGLMLKAFATSANEQTYMKLLGETPSFASVAKGVQFAYKKATEIFNRLPPMTKATQVYKFLQFHSARDEGDVKIVKLHLGEHTTLNPLKLEQALKELSNGIRATYRMDTKWPMILFYDAGSGKPPSTIYSPNVIFSITVKIDSRQIGYIYHLVKEGARFATLIQEE